MRGGGEDKEEKSGKEEEKVNGRVVIQDRVFFLKDQIHKKCFSRSICDTQSDTAVASWNKAWVGPQGHTGTQGNTAVCRLSAEHEPRPAGTRGVGCRHLLRIIP